MNAQSNVRRNAALNKNESLILKIRHSLAARSSATSSGNAKLKTESQIQLAPGSSVSSQIGSSEGNSTIIFERDESSAMLNSEGIRSDSQFIFDESTTLDSKIETLGENVDQGTQAEATSNLIQESTLEVTYQDAETLSTFQQAF